ncbi:unnamed protein product [Ambrosiozyma monospora]|uniref:Unnamed protein product n=1 Tax=Ambrosiozyma monospora TaxID=43982 RepID=A0A9W6Z4U7_AMBMO|nr:unnamed protein product [Ambrosiozyma monospora]
MNNQNNQNTQNNPNPNGFFKPDYNMNSHPNYSNYPNQINDMNSMNNINNMNNVNLNLNINSFTNVPNQQTQQTQQYNINQQRVLTGIQQMSFPNSASSSTPTTPTRLPLPPSMSSNVNSTSPRRDQHLSRIGSTSQSVRLPLTHQRLPSLSSLAPVNVSSTNQHQHHYSTSLYSPSETQFRIQPPDLEQSPHHQLPSIKRHQSEQLHQADLPASLRNPWFSTGMGGGQQQQQQQQQQLSSSQQPSTSTSTSTSTSSIAVPPPSSSSQYTVRQRLPSLQPPTSGLIHPGSATSPNYISKLPTTYENEGYSISPPRSRQQHHQHQHQQSQSQQQIIPPSRIDAPGPNSSQFHQQQLDEPQSFRQSDIQRRQSVAAGYMNYYNNNSNDFSQVPQHIQQQQQIQPTQTLQQRASLQQLLPPIRNDYHTLRAELSNPQELEMEMGDQLGTPPRAIAPCFTLLKRPTDMQPRINKKPKFRRVSSTNKFVSPLKALTTSISITYSMCVPEFNYRSSKNPRRVLTKPNQPKFNNGHDNEDSDYILYVNDVLGVQENRKYMVLDILGHGTFGQVVKCQDLKTQELVAIKVVKSKPVYLNQSLTEANILEHLNNKVDPHGNHHFLKMKDKFIHKNHLCIVTELLSSNLYDLIRQNQFHGLTIKLIKKFAIQLLDSLCVLKQSKLIHCDLKPENILLCSLDKPDLKVIDFGSACHERQVVNK